MDRGLLREIVRLVADTYTARAEMQRRTYGRVFRFCKNCRLPLIPDPARGEFYPCCQTSQSPAVRAGSAAA